MYNPKLHITAAHFNRLLRLHLLDTSNKEETQNIFEMQAGFVFSESETKEKLSGSEKRFIEKLAYEKNYVSSNWFNKGFFTWIFSSLSVLVILFILWNSFITNSNVVIARQVERYNFPENISTCSNNNIGPKTPSPLYVMISNKYDSPVTATVLPKQVIKKENDSYFIDSKFPFKQPKIIYSKDNSIFLNLDFEVKTQDTHLPEIWGCGQSGKNIKEEYSIELDTLVKYSGKNSVVIKSTDEKAKQKKGWSTGGITSALPSEYFKDKDSIQISAYIKTENIEKGSAMLWCSEWDSKPHHNAIQYDNTYSQGGKGTTDWKKYTISLPIDTATKSISFGGFLNGVGTVWFDKFEIIIDGEKVKDVAPIIKNPEPKEVEWLNTNCIPVKTINTGNGFDDLNKLNEIIGDAQIVALGGSSYGSSDELLMKQRISEYLISEKKFNIICIDAGMPEVSILNDYILNDNETTIPSLDSLHSWIYNCKETQSILQWLKNYNHNQTEKIIFYGITSSYNNKALKMLKDFATANDKTLLDKILDNEKKYALLKEKVHMHLTQNSFVDAKLSLKLLKKIEPSLQQISAHFDKNKTNYLKTISLTQYEWLKQMIVILKQNITQSLSSYNYYYLFRTDNINWIMKQNPDSKVIIWANNSFVGKENDWLSTGKLLFRDYGNKYASIGFATDSGSFTAYNDSVLSINNLQSSPKGSFEDYFKQCKYPDYIIDIRKKNICDSSSNWLGNEMLFRQLWATVNQKQFNYTKITGKYDAIIFLRNTEHSECFDIGMKKKTSH